MSPADAAATNTLGLATSPYLRQHADNPVHWQQWTPQALAAAAERDVPILLSIGYAACHWCHVMAHESFEDDEVAAAMNAGFVCIKVDREERPDLDAVYMNATVALTGHGGWPMTCFLTPDGRPFFCGTYYPKEGFLQLLSAVSATWHQRRGEVEEASEAIAGELRAMVSGLPSGGPDVAPTLCDHAVAAVLDDQDTVHGGFGGAPKFPPSAILEALLRNYERTGSKAGAGGGRAHRRRDGPRRHLRPARGRVRPLQRRQRLGGTAFREDAVRQRVAAARLRALGPADRGSVGAPGHRPRPRASCSTICADGAMFTSSLDADADGREGSTYVWTPEQLTEVLGADDGAWAATVFAVTASGTFEHGTSVLQLPADPDDPQRLERVRTALLTARLTRTAARARRQGRHVLERAGDHRAGRGQCGPGRIRAGPRRAGLRDRAAGAAPRRRAAAARQPGRRWSAPAPRSSRTTRCWPPVCSRSTS